MNSQELAERAGREYEKLKARRRSLYKLARHLEFSASEARVLSGTNELNIATIAKERGKDIELGIYETEEG